MEGWLTGTKPVSSKADDPGKKSEDKKLPWIEKYRPKTMDDVAYQHEVVAVLKKCITGSDLPNLLFYGPPGTGKTSAILAAARELFGGEYYRDRVLELNASDERGIQVVREKVKSFAQSTISNTLPNGKPCLPLKLIILDEADSMTSAAQAALRRTMEKQSKHTRFCLICNYISRIIDPLTSRCAKFRFKPLDRTIQKERLKFIADKEGVDIEESAVDVMTEVCEGDLRKSITFLQTAARFKPGGQVQKEDVLSLVGVIPDEDISKILKSCQSGSFEKVQSNLEEFFRQGYPAYQALSQLHDCLIESDDLSDLQKAAIFDRLALTEVRLLEGAEEFLQLLDLCSLIMAQYKLAR